MYVLITIGALYYGDPMLTFPTYHDAFVYAGHLDGWWEIEEIVEQR